MRLGLLAGLVLLSAAHAQTVISPSRLSQPFRTFDAQPGETALKCSVSQLKPVLNFSFRLQGGWILRVPMGQYSGPRHRWSIVTKVTPEGGRSPVYLASNMRLPNVPKTNVQFEVAGSYLLGEGKYKVEWKLVDDAGRVCRARWNVEAKLKRSERAVQVAIPAATVSDLAGRGVPRETLRSDAPPFRLTVMMHAAPLTPRRMPRLSPQDRMTLTGLLGSLLERLPTSSVRLVVFNLDHQKELLREDHAGPQTLSQVWQAVNELELGLVDVQTLQNRKGHVDLLADLVTRELAEPAPSDVVVFLGPPARFWDKMPENALDRVKHPQPDFFYLQFRPSLQARMGRRGIAGEVVFPDSIQSAMSRVGGKLLVIRTPGDFARALQLVERRTTETASK